MFFFGSSGFHSNFEHCYYTLLYAYNHMNLNDVSHMMEKLKQDLLFAVIRFHHYSPLSFSLSSERDILFLYNLHTQAVNSTVYMCNNRCFKEIY